MACDSQALELLDLLLILSLLLPALFDKLVLCALHVAPGVTREPATHHICHLSMLLLLLILLLLDNLLPASLLALQVSSSPPLIIIVLMCEFS